MNTTLHKEDNHFAVVTDAADEAEFRGEFVAAISQMIEEGIYDGDWSFNLDGWMEQAAEITCKLRGYKAQVVERRVIIAGVLDPDAAVMAVARSETPAAE